MTNTASILIALINKCTFSRCKRSTVETSLYNSSQVAIHLNRPNMLSHLFLFTALTLPLLAVATLARAAGAGVQCCSSLILVR